MPDSCAAWGCNRRRAVRTRSQGITFHRFPSDPALKKQWEFAVRREDFIASPSTVLCSQHFKEEDIDRTGQIVRIREGVVPSVFSFPPHLQKQPVTPRKTKTSQKATAPVQVPEQTEAVEAESQPREEHSYAAPASLERMKDKLAQAHARMEELERQLRNAKDRERRCKTALKSVLHDASVTRKRLRLSLQSASLGAPV
ncbi:THAP domain-containing protein 6-like isoform X2 [Salminus brasiliensis]|uniref:THAP domain-containing protein 6-like isoform X2 n=1 Tax=Salminus brasiliensis TaxID=930266 RepID=UPI003B82CCBE